MVLVALSPVALLTVLAAMTTGTPVPVPDVPWEETRRQGLVHLRLLDPFKAEAYLAAAEARPKPVREQAKTLLLLARARNAAKRPAEALATLDRLDVTTLDPALRDLPAFERILALDAQDHPTARQEIRRFLKAHPRSNRRDEARLMLGERALEAGDGDEARAVAGTVLETAALDRHRAEALYLLARASAEPRRRELLVRLYVEFPATPVAEICGLTEDELDMKLVRQRAHALFKAMDYVGYQRLLQRLWAGGDHSGSLAYRLALSHLSYVRDDARKAIRFLDLARAGGALGAGEAAYQKARAYAKLEEYDQSAAQYREYLRRAPRGRHRVKALYYQGWLPYDHGRYQEALPELDRFLRKVKKHKLRSYIVWAKAWSLYKLKRHREALKVFDRMLKMGNKLVAGKAMYWGGMSHRALGHKAEAVRWMEMALDRYPMTYYAVLAAKRLHQWEGIPLPPWMVGPSLVQREPEELWALDRLPEPHRSKLRLVKDFADVGETARARRIYRPLARSVEKRLKGEDRARFLLTVYAAIEDYNTLHRKASSDFANRMSKVPDSRQSLFWMVRYPRAHRGMARELSVRFGLPEHWIYSIMRQESRYDPRQVSHTAALGIMQMIPKTAKVVSRALGVDFEVESFFGPGRNLLFGTYYLGGLLKDFKGQMVFASAGYNAGAPPIKRFLTQHRGLPFDEMVEHISYNEGRNYCRLVAGHLVRYAYLHLPPRERETLYDRLFPDRVDYELGTGIDY